MPPAPPARPPSALDVLRDRSAGRYLLGSTMSGVAMFLQAAALGKHVYDITDSEFLLGMLGLVEFAPAFLLLPVTGSVADRFDRRRVAAIGLSVEAITAIAFVLYALTDPTSAGPMFLIAAVFGTARAFVSPSNRAIPPLVAPDGGLARVMAVYAATWQIGLIAGPASSGLLYDVSPALPYGAAAAFFLLAAITIGTVRTRRPQIRTSADVQPSFHHALEGLRFIRGRPVLFGAIALDMFAVLFGGAVALLPAIAEDRLGAGNVGYGWLRAAPGIGAVVFAAAMAIRPIRRRVGRALLIVVAVFGAATVVLGLTRNYAIAFLALVVLAGADAISVFIRTTIVPLATPDDMRGRVSAVENVFVGASNEVGAFESGVASSLLGVGPAVVLGGVVTMGVVAVWSVAFPALRDIDRFEDVDVGHVRPIPVPADG
ncbi:MFS transporter [Desertimonas flava]|uniref:MFS transporter n=1 Tax=Desertimonas flava TaxID=2064846 RepID=UPI000E344D64|nr:MFS transporter [Desertimonas flava]